jgi:hypothetical protein
MPRMKATRLKDAFGQWCEVGEYRGTPHGFDLILGWPEGRKKGRAGGRSQVILTKPLARYLTRFRMRPWEIDLPIAPKTLGRLRRELGHHIRRDIRRWWEDRREDLATLSRVQFAKRHGRKEGAVGYQGRNLVGPRIRPRYWWKAPEVLSVLFSKRTDAEVAAALKISASFVRRMRANSRQGKLRKPRGWWRAPSVQAILFSGRPDSEIARAKAGRCRPSLNRSEGPESQQRGPLARRLRRKRAGWWTVPKVQALLFSGRPFREIAAKLRISPYRVSVLQMRSRRAAQHGCIPARQPRRNEWPAAQASAIAVAASSTLPCDPSPGDNP